MVIVIQGYCVHCSALTTQTCTNIHVQGGSARNPVATKQYSLLNPAAAGVVCKSCNHMYMFIQHSLISPPFHSPVATLLNFQWFSDRGKNLPRLCILFIQNMGKYDKSHLRMPYTRSQSPVRALSTVLIGVPPLVHIPRLHNQASGCT